MLSRSIRRKILFDLGRKISLVEHSNFLVEAVQYNSHIRIRLNGSTSTIYEEGIARKIVHDLGGLRFTRRVYRVTLITLALISVVGRKRGSGNLRSRSPDSTGGEDSYVCVVSRVDENDV